MSRILFAEDEPGIVRFVTRGLAVAGHVTHAVPDGDEALLLALSGEFDLLLLDLGLPGRDGFGVLTELRLRHSRLPVIVLTARAGERDVVAGLEGGADDYLTKPFRLAELVARVHLRLRDDHAREPYLFTAGSLTLDVRTRQARVDGETVDLTAKEFSLASLLVQHAGQVLSREQILSHVWGYDYDPGSNVVDVYIRYLRQKLGSERILTVRGAGYRLTAATRTPCG